MPWICCGYKLSICRSPLPSAPLRSAYLVYDIQLMLGGKNYAVSEDEYVFAALSIYLDVVLLFLFVLQFLGMARSSA